jgi:hypothetical protein
MPAPTLDAVRQAVTGVVPSRLPEFFQEIQDAFSQAGDEDSVFPIRHFYQRWSATIAIERRPSVAVTDDLLDGLPPDALRAIRRLAEELAVRESMVFLDAAEFTATRLGCALSSEVR